MLHSGWSMLTTFSSIQTGKSPWLQHSLYTVLSYNCLLSADVLQETTVVFEGVHTQPIYLLAEERVKTLPFLVCRSLTGGVAKSQCLLIQRFGPSSHLGSAPSSPTHTEQGPCLASASTDPVQQWVLLLNQHHRNYRFLNIHPPVGDSMQPLHLCEGAIPSVARVALLGWLS